MMMAVGCIQAQTCHTNTCPVGVATQDPKRMRALYVPDKAERVTAYQESTVEQAMQIVASMGLHSFDELRPHMLRRRIQHGEIASYADLVEHLEPGQLLERAPRALGGRLGGGRPGPVRPLTRSPADPAHEPTQLTSRPDLSAGAGPASACREPHRPRRAG